MEVRACQKGGGKRKKSVFVSLSPPPSPKESQMDGMKRQTIRGTSREVRKKLAEVATSFALLFLPPFFSTTRRTSLPRSFE